MQPCLFGLLKKEEDESASTRPAGFAAGKKGRYSRELESIRVRNRSGFEAFRSDHVVSKRVRPSVRAYVSLTPSCSPHPPIQSDTQCMKKRRETEEEGRGREVFSFKT